MSLRACIVAQTRPCRKEVAARYLIGTTCLPNAPCDRNQAGSSRSGHTIYLVSIYT